MNKLLRRRILLALPIVLLSPLAWADEVEHAAGRFALWLPPGWPYALQGERLSAKRPRGGVTVIAGPLAEREAGLADRDVIGFIDDELDTMTVETDVSGQHRGLPARLLAGSGIDDDEAVKFRAVAIGPAETRPVLMALVYGVPDAFVPGTNAETIEHILSSFRPL